MRQHRALALGDPPNALAGGRPDLAAVELEDDGLAHGSSSEKYFMALRIGFAAA